MHSPSTPDSGARRRRATAGAFVGTAIEWYDFFIFGTAAALAFSEVFYPGAMPGAGILASFATFWVGFLARPIGGVVFGHLGDRFGRKNTMVATLFLMGIATTAIGLLPGYASIGIAAPILLVLFRAMQGLAVGGEWAGATLMATENAGTEKRGMAGAWVQQGSPAGSILASLVFLAVGGLSDEAFLAWGWRVPFLLSAVLLIVGLLIRLKVEESADFQEARRRDEVVRVPVVTVFRTAPAFVFLGVAASAIGIASAFFNNTFLLSWTTTELGVDRQPMLNALLIAAVLQFLWQPFAARIAERRGAQAVMLVHLAITTAAIVPLFLAVLSAAIVPITLAIILSTVAVAGYYAMLSSFLSRSFPANIRYTGVAMANGLCASLIGGSAPLLAQWLLTTAGPWSVALFYAAMTLFSIYGVVALQRRIDRRDASTVRPAPGEAATREAAPAEPGTAPPAG